MAYTQNEVNQLVKNAAQQAGGTLSYADAVRAAANLGIPASQISAAASTGLITGTPAAAPVMPTTYDQAYVNQLVQEAATQAGGTLSYADTVNAAKNLGIPLSMINAAMAGGAITGGPTTTTTKVDTTKVDTTKTNTGTVTGLPTGYDQAYINRLIGEAAKQAGGTLSYADAANALRNLGVPLSMLNAAMGTGLITEGVNPFANATQGMQGNTRGTYTSIPIGVQSFDQNFKNYMSTPLGAQYNPGVTGGVSPYSAVMNQMQDFRNPYAGVMANQPIGGYNPNIYNPNLLSDFMKQRAAELSAAGLPVPFGMDGGDGPGGVGDGAGSGAGDGGPGGAAGGGSGPGDGPGTGAGWYMGGLIDRVSGANPSGPDDGQINAQIGEYVVKKSSVDKYGKGLLDMINEGKIPAKKIKSLLD